PPASEGFSQGPCGNKYANYVGRLPWKSLGIPVLRDGDAECLWYAVAGSYKNANVKTDMLNEDTDGQFEVFASDGVTRIAGGTPGKRPVAVVFAGRAILGPQNRSLLPTGTEVCGGNFGAANYLEAANSRNNAVLSLAQDTVDTLFTGDTRDASGNVIANERLIYITKDEIFDAIKKRTDFNQKLQSLNQSLATCISAYGLSGPPGDRRLPWAASIALPDYRDVLNYVDENNRLSGRLPDQAPVTQGATTRAFSMSNCLSSNPEQLQLWENWKDHFFYAVAEAFKPSSPPGTQVCSPLLNNCLTVNGGTINKYAAIVFFSRSALAGQSRNAPPIDPDEKANISNYLEGKNDDPNVGNNDYDSVAPSPTFNDFLSCIDDSLVVQPCGSAL
ncbi:MAG: hypothetical protein ACRERD_11465, partial [Candidatus Binatia bacterium]